MNGQEKILDLTFITDKKTYRKALTGKEYIEIKDDIKDLLTFEEFVSYDTIDELHSEKFTKYLRKVLELAYPLYKKACYILNAEYSYTQKREIKIKIEEANYDKESRDESSNYLGLIY